MGISYNGVVVDMAFNGERVEGAAFNGKVVYRPGANPAGIPAGAKLLYLQYPDLDHTAGDVFEMPVAVPLELKGDKGSIHLAMKFKLEKTGSDYVVTLGDISGDIPAPGTTVSLHNTAQQLTGLNAIYLRVNLINICVFVLNGLGDVIAVSPLLPGAAVADVGVSATDYFHKFAMHGKNDPVLFTALYNSLRVAIPPGSTNPAKIEIYWT